MLKQLFINILLLLKLQLTPFMYEIAGREYNNIQVEDQYEPL